uniref:Uncharacterized protein n=1 Tax=Arundo donax TaxID=35708 RepID=A0A0A9A3J7_ARUDO
MLVFLDLIMLVSGIQTTFCFTGV